MNIAEYWQAQSAKNIKTYKSLKKRTILFFILQLLLFGYWISGIGSIQLPGNMVFLVIVVLFPIIPVAVVFFYANYHLDRFDNLFEKGQFINISASMPEKLKIRTEITAQFKISDSMLEWWIDCNSSANIFVHRFSGINHVVMSLGYLKLLNSEPGYAKAILAHELAHVRQEDPEHLIINKVFLKAFTLFYFPFVLLVNGVLVLLTLNHIAYLKDRLDGMSLNFLLDWEHSLKITDSHFQQVEANLRMIDNNIISVVGLFAVVIILLINMVYSKRFAAKAETAADLGASLVCGTEYVIGSMTAYARSVNRIGNLFGVNPSIKSRIRALNKLKEQFPDLPETEGIALDKFIVLQPTGPDVPPGNHFGNVPYNPEFRNNLSTGINTREKTLLKLVLFFLIPVLFIIRYAEIFYGAFSDYDANELIIFCAHLLFCLSSIATGIQLVKRRAHLAGYMFFLFSVVLFITAIMIGDYYKSDEPVLKDLYMFGYKLEHGFIFASMGWLAISIFLLLIISVLFVYKTSLASVRKNFTYFAAALFMGFTSVLLLAAASFPPRNPDLARAIQVAGFNTPVTLDSVDRKYIYLHVGAEEGNQQAYKLENSKSLLAGHLKDNMPDASDSAGYFQRADLLELSDLTFTEQWFLKKYQSGMYATSRKYARSSRGRYLMVIPDFPNDRWKIFGGIEDDYNAAFIKEIDDRRKFATPGWDKSRSACFSYDEKYIMADGGDGEIRIFKIAK